MGFGFGDLSQLAWCSSEKTVLLSLGILIVEESQYAVEHCMCLASTTVPTILTSVEHG